MPCPRGVAALRLSWHSVGIASMAISALLASVMVYKSRNFRHAAGLWAAAPACPAASVQAALAASTTAANRTGRYVFVDLGANRADTLKVFLGRPDAKFKYKFATPPDGRSPQDAEIFLFEANPLFNTDLVLAKEESATQGITVHIYPSQIVHTEDSVVDFYVDGLNARVDFWASSMKPSTRKERIYFTKVRLTAVNIANFLLMNFVPEDFVIVKMDIESAEYDIIPHMSAMCTSTVVNYMYVEWHDGFKSITKKAKERAQAAKAAMEAAGTQFPQYDSPA